MSRVRKAAMFQLLMAESRHIAEMVHDDDNEFQ